MSKDLALEQTEWDLHDNPEAFIPIEFTEEIKPDLFGLELAKAQEMTSGLSTVIAEREVLKNAYLDVTELEINSETLPIFKELRLKIVKNRTQGIEKWHKTNKAFYLAGGRFVDAVKNKEILVNEEMESKLMEAEKYFENLEKEAKAKLNAERIEIIRPYVDDVFGLDFSDFSDENFDDFILGKKTRFENAKIEAERIEIEAKKEALVLKLHNERSTLLLPVWSFILEADQNRNWGAFDEETFNSCLKTYQDRKANFDMDQEKQRLENILLKKEAEAKEAELQRERIKAKVETDRIEAENNAKLEAQRKETDRLSAELQAKKDAEIKSENERLAKIESDKQAAATAAKAPVKEQMTAWVDSFEIPEPSINNDASKIIIDKFLSFKNWAKNEIEKI